MVADKISSKDIRQMGRGGVLTATLPNYRACMTAKNLVTYTKNMYPREDGLTYTCSIDRETNTITIRVVEPEKDE